MCSHVEHIEDLVRNTALDSKPTANERVESAVLRTASLRLSREEPR